MRQLRPEYYSDTEDRVAYVLDESVFSHRLETITDRNETHDFELFARKLCERAICPNLRPQTGPEWGGDSKADSETYPVAEEISRLYISDANGGRERWAFAFSAKKKWAEKVRGDTKGIVETGRAYAKIIHVTSRSARAKLRAQLEDELSKQYGIPVTIHDRSWIIKEVIENDRKDLAFNYLGVGAAKTDPLQLGPTDYSRTRQLTAIEKSLDDPDAFLGMERQRVAEALLAAKLSRNLERPRVETDGRFERAIRLANADGSYRQQLEAEYERLWTAFWWFDDVALLNSEYDAFEKKALLSDHASNLEFLCNLFQLLVNAVIYGHLTREVAKLDRRMSTLRAALDAIAAQAERPNNSLEAQTSFLILRQNQAMLDHRPEDFPEIWRDYSKVLDQAQGLGEFKAQRLISMIEVVGKIAGNDAAYNELVEKVAAFVAKRSSEADGAIILLKRAQQLDFPDRIDVIRLLGRAAMYLSKKEHTEKQIDALQLLSLAYRSAGLLWAARAACIMAAAAAIVEGEEDSTIPVSFVPTMKLWAWIALQLGHLPDFLYAIQLLNGALATLPLSDDSKIKVEEDLRELDYALGSVVLNLDAENLSKLDRLPDILEGLGLFMARAALLYALGYDDVLRADGSIPKEETDEGAEKLFSRLASQPVARQAKTRLITNEDSIDSRSTTIVGMLLDVTFPAKPHLVVIAETLIGSVEAFMATLIDQRVAPHTEKFSIAMHESESVSEPAITTSTLEMSSTAEWPAGLSVNDFSQQRVVRRFFAEMAGHVLGTACVIENLTSLLEKLYDDEAVDARLSLIAAMPNSYHRVASRNISRLSDWNQFTKRKFELRSARPEIKHIPLKEPAPEPSEDEDLLEEPRITNHTAMCVRSVIDVHAWDRAAWKGTCYGDYGPGRPPCMALMFENENAARKIFERWRERFGRTDQDEEIYIAIIREVGVARPYDYIVLVTSKLPASQEGGAGMGFLTASRSMTMNPDNGVNLTRFLESYRPIGAYYLMPPVVGNGPPKLIPELGLVKRNLSVTVAANVGPHDIETMALRIRGKVA